jgi:hypothetical protein
MGLRPVAVAVLVLALSACGGATLAEPPSQPGGSTDMQPGSGGNLKDVQRAQHGYGGPGRGDTAQPVGAGQPREPSAAERGGGKP